MGMITYTVVFITSDKQMHTDKSGPYYGSFLSKGDADALVNKYLQQSDIVYSYVTQTYEMG